MARAGADPEVVLEATYGWYWAVDALQEAGAHVHLAHPLGVKAFEYRRVKNDVRDATDLADLLRMGRLPEAWIAPPATRELRELVRHRAKLVGLRSHCKAEVHAVLAKCGIQVTLTDLFGVGGTDLLDRLALPAPYAARVASLRRVMEDLDFEIDLFTGRREGMTERHHACSTGNAGHDASHAHLTQQAQDRSHPTATTSHSMRRTGSPSRPSDRYAVGLRPNLTPTPSSARPATRSGPEEGPATTLDRPRSFRDDLQNSVKASFAPPGFARHPRLDNSPASRGENPSWCMFVSRVFRKFVPADGTVWVDVPSTDADPVSTSTPCQSSSKNPAEGRSNLGIAQTLWVTEGTVEKHVWSIVTKLDLDEESTEHRRVLAVLTFLQSH